ncbi:MAG: phosphoglycerate mutase family protein [Candidatus Levyibacteriota bacterium]
MKTIYIFRHAKSVEDGQEYGEKILTADILPHAKEPIEKMGIYLKTVLIDTAFCSEVKRCRQTANIVSGKTGIQFITDKRINEYYLEQFGDFRKRVQSFFKDLEKMKEETILICTHGAVIAGLTHLLLEGTFENFQLLDFPNPGVLIKITEKKLEEIDFN